MRKMLSYSFVASIWLKPEAATSPENTYPAWGTMRARTGPCSRGGTARAKSSPNCFSIPFRRQDKIARQPPVPDPAVGSIHPHKIRVSSLLPLHKLSRSYVGTNVPRHRWAYWPYASWPLPLAGPLRILSLKTLFTILVSAISFDRVPHLSDNQVTFSTTFCALMKSKGRKAPVP